METHPVVAVLLTITALVVIVPVLVQVLREGYRLRQVWGLLAVGAGMLIVAAGYGLFDDHRQRYLAVAGFALAVLGMFVQHRRAD